MSVAVERTPLTPDEEEILRDQIIPILQTVLPAPFVPRALLALKTAIEQSKKKHGMAFGGLYPNSGQVGVQPITPREFDLATTWTLRTNWASTTWQKLIDSKTLSKYTHLVICGYENLEAVPRTAAIKETVGGMEHPVIDLAEIKKNDRQFQAIEPYITSPISVFTLEVYVEETGYDNLRPWGFVVAPYAYLVSKTFIE
jgi:hypothetical protein